MFRGLEDPAMLREDLFGLDIWGRMNLITGRLMSIFWRRGMGFNSKGPLMRGNATMWILKLKLIGMRRFKLSNRLISWPTIFLFLPLGRIIFRTLHSLLRMRFYLPAIISSHWKSLLISAITTAKTSGGIL